MADNVSALAVVPTPDPSVVNAQDRACLIRITAGLDDLLDDKAGGIGEMMDGLTGDFSGMMRLEKRGRIRTVDIQSPTPLVAAE